MKTLLSLMAAVAAALMMATTSTAGTAPLRLPHSKPFPKMTHDELHAYLVRQKWHDVTALRWLRNHPLPQRALTSEMTVNEHALRVRWFTTSLRIVSDRLRKMDTVTLSSSWLVGAFMCIHHYEGAWGDDTGNGFYGGLQFDYGTWLSAGGGRYATTANLATPAEQIAVAINLWHQRGFQPWPRTSVACGLR